MIIALLVIIFLAIVFPGLFRFVFGAIGFLVLLAIINQHVDIGKLFPVLVTLVVGGFLIAGYEKFSKARKSRADKAFEGSALRQLNKRISPRDPDAARKRGEQSALSFELTKRRALRVKSPGYVWRSSGDTDVCPVCAANNGKFFKWSAPPACGHPGVHHKCPEGLCRCWAEPIVPD